MTEAEQQRRSAGIGVAMLLALAALIVAASGTNRTAKEPTPPVITKPEPPPEAKPVAVPKAKPAPLPKLRAPAPIMREHKKTRRKRAEKKLERKIKARPRMPSCAAIRSAYNRMDWSAKMAAYRRASAEQIAHGRKCLGL